MKKIKIKINGRPGWHIECSVMSQKFSKTNALDIHAGGRDLIFPHHENEIAQAEAVTGKPFARYWLHHGLLTINGQKMAKSSGNFITIKDVLKKYPADVLKLCYLTVHYSNPMDFSWERMDIAKKELADINDCIKRIEGYIEQREKNWIQATPIITYADFKIKIDNLKEKFEDAMNSDFNTPQAKAIIFQIINLFYRDNFQLENVDCLKYAKDAIITLCKKVFALSLGINDTITLEIAAMIEERNKARSERDFKKADSIRKELEEKGIMLEDVKDGTTKWRRKI